MGAALSTDLFFQPGGAGDAVAGLLAGAVRAGAGSVLADPLPLHDHNRAHQPPAGQHRAGEVPRPEDPAVHRAHRQAAGLRERHEPAARGRARVRVPEGDQPLLLRPAGAGLQEAGGAVPGEVRAGAAGLRPPQLPGRRGQVREAAAAAAAAAGTGRAGAGGAVLRGPDRQRPDRQRDTVHPAAGREAGRRLRQASQGRADGGVRLQIAFRLVFLSC